MQGYGALHFYTTMEMKNYEKQIIATEIIKIT